MTVAITGESDQPVSIFFKQIVVYLETDKSLIITRDKCRLVQIVVSQIIALRVMLEKFWGWGMVIWNTSLCTIIKV